MHIGDWDLEAVPDHLRMTFAVCPDDQPGGQALATGKDLVQLRRALSAELGRTLAAAAPELRRTGLTHWDFGDFVDQLTVAGDAHPVVGYPALVDEGSTVGLAVLESPSRQAASHRAGLRRLVLLNTPDPTKWVVSHLGMTEKLALGSSPYAGSTRAARRRPAGLGRGADPPPAGSRRGADRGGILGPV